MASTSKMMYDTFKDEIWEELGPLDPNWFDALTAKADEENVPEQDNLSTFNQDGPFKTPFEKNAVESQLFSTPKIFRRCRVQSPETEDEQFFSAEQETESLPWAAASPCLFGTSKERTSDTKSYGHMQLQNSFDLLDTPQKPSVDFAQHISESLGAQIHPDISWTSSLNTPPALPSTLILSKNEESPCPPSPSADKNVIFVRKLFPSLSNVSRDSAVTPIKNEIPPVQQAVDSPEPGQGRNSHDATECSLNQSGSDWKQTLPDAIKDGEIRSTVASVLDGAENVLSIFFTNSSSALRRVKTDRIKRKQGISAKDHGVNSTDILTTNNMAPSERTAEQTTDDQELGIVPLSPHLKSQVKTGDIGNTQWSPMGLSEISHSAMDASCHVDDAAKQRESSVATEHLGSDSDHGQLVRPSLISTDSLFTRKKRRFVYTVHSAKPQLQEKDFSTEKTGSSPGNPVSAQELDVKQMESAPAETQCYNAINEMQKQENAAEENLPPSAATKSQDLDMSQLCRDFAQDFPPTVDPSALSKVEDDTPRAGFSPSACLSALRQRNKQKSSQSRTSFHRDCSGVSNKSHVPTTHVTDNKIESSVSDSGFQSASVDVTQTTATASVLPSLQKNAISQPWPDFKTGIHRTPLVKSATKETGKALMDDTLNGPVTDAKLSISLVKQSQTPDHGTENALTHPLSSAKGVNSKRNCIQQNGPVHANLPPEATVSLPSIHASGFKTASNRGIRVSKVNLERAKNLFKEIEAESPLSDQPTNCSSNTKDEIDMINKAVENSISNSNHPPSSSGQSGDAHCALTASQKADVTELCSLLEKADSQFEFTQVKAEKQNQHCKEEPLSQRVDKELDPDFLAGINFDDSFSSDAEKQVAKTMTPDKVTSVAHNKRNYKAGIQSKSSCTSLSSAVKKGKDSSGNVFSTSEGLPGIVSPKLQNNFSIAGHTEAIKPVNINPPVFGVGFKTAGGNILKVSNKDLSKARALFADLEENPVTISDTGDNIVTTNAKQISVKANQQHNVDNIHNGNFLHSKEDDSKCTGNHINTEERSKVCFSDVTESPCLDGWVPEIRTDEHTTKSHELENNMNTNCQSGFQMASGKGITISAKAIHQANAVFRDCDVTDSYDCMSEHNKDVPSVTGSLRDKKNSSNFQAVKGNTNDEPVRGSTEREIVNSGPIASHTKIQHCDDAQIHSGGFKNTPALTNALSFHGKPSLTAKRRSSSLYTASKDVGSSVTGELSSDNGFCTASGRKVPVSDEAMAKAKSLLNECDALEDRNKQKQLIDSRASCQTGQIPALPPQNGGFQTASGKGVAISTMALKKAKVLLSEYDDVEENKEIRPMHPSSPVCDPPPRNGGFCTASGRKVPVSDAAMTKAKSLLNECDALEDRNKPKQEADRQTSPIPVVPPQNGGFQTASGKGVAISTMALKKAKALLSDCDGVENEMEIRPSPMCHPPPMQSGFCTASGNKVPVPDDAMTKAKSLLNECDAFEDRNKPKQEADSRTYRKTSPIPVVPPQNGGFQTASGRGVAVSAMALKKAEALLSGCDGVENERETRPMHPNSPMCHPPPMKSGFWTASGNKVSVTDDAMTKAKSLLNECDALEDRSKHNQKADSRTYCQTSPIPAVPPQNGGFQTASGKGVAISTMALKKAKALLSECDGVENEKEIRPSPMCHPPPMKSGFCTASGNKVSVSDDAMTKAKSLLNECDAFENRNQHKQKADTLRTSHQTSPIRNLPPQNNGFHTASGKGVVISATALKKAKALLSEHDGTEDEKEIRPTHPNTPIYDPRPRNNGFSAASGKPVAFSAKALQKAKALFSDIGVNAETPIVSDTKKTDEDAHIAEKMNSTFTTARGTKVHVSKKNLLKAKNLLNTECPDSVITPRSLSSNSLDTHMSDMSKVNVLKITSSSDLTTSSQKEVPVQENAPHVVPPFLTSHETENTKETRRNSGEDNRSFSRSDSVSEKASKEASKFKDSTEQDIFPDRPREKRPTVVDCGFNQTSSSDAHQFTRRNGSSVLNFQSLNIGDCTDTQQQFFAQEAMDCTKALLEDEDLADQRLDMTLAEMPLQDNPEANKRSGETRKGIGKRSAEDADMTGQPPLKRRLLEEFDRTADGPRGSTLHAAKSCPDGVSKDRRVFKYSISLHPNITRPFGDGKPYVETSLQKTEQMLARPNPTLGESGPSHSKMTVFVPPFQKKMKTETLKCDVPKDKARPTSVFVPPFKKRTAVKESSPQPQTKEDKCQHLYVTPNKTNSYVPPTKTTNIPTEVTDSKGKEDIQTLGLLDAGNLESGENASFGHGTEDSVKEASGVEDRLSSNQEIGQSLEFARDMQDMRIRKKKRQTIRALSGSLFLAKTSGGARIPLKGAVNGQSPALHTQKQLYGYGVHRHVTEITSENAQYFRFTFQQFFKQEVLTERGGVQLADGGWLIPRNDGTAGKEEFYRALCDTPGVDPKLMSEEWVYNHYRWIVWKQASMERSFPATMGSLCLNPEQVLLQLKYRYDVEVDHSRRPALRKIMEKDDTAAKTLVLCVCGIVSRGHDPTKPSRSDVQSPQGADSKVENPAAVVWLTDGWYAIKAQLDVPLTAMLHKGRLALGGKLITHGAELVGSQDACSPLEAPESLMLKICANSSRLARWDTKLGFHKDPRPFLLPVSSLYSNGGVVGCVDIVILRSYPIQWMERKPDGGFVFRCDRAEEKEARRFNNSKQKAMEILSAKIQAEFEKEEKGTNKPQGRRQTLSRQDIESLQDGEDLHEAVENDPVYLEAHLSEQQLETLHSYRRSLAEKKQAELQERYRRALEDAQESEGTCPKRDVTPVWKLCIADSRDQLGSNVYLLNLWRPSTDLLSLLKEGCRFRVYNLTTSDGKRRAGCATIQLTATKKTQFQELQASQEWFSTHFQPRVSANFLDLHNPEFHPVCGEVDLVGYIIAITDGQGSFPVLYLVDGRLNFVKVCCSSSLAQSALEDMVKPLVLVALSNVQLGAQSSSPIPTLYTGDLTLFSTNPKEAHLQEAATQLRNLVEDHENFFTIAEERLSDFVPSNCLSTNSSSAPQPRTPGCRKDGRQDTRTCVAPQQPVKSSGTFTPLSRKLPPANSSSEKNPKLLKRRRALEYLSHVPSPPPVCHLGTAPSPCVNKTFNPPRRSGTPCTLKTVQTPARKSVVLPPEDRWVNDEELAMIDTQALHTGNLSR